jgi:hypothetical protein
MHLEVDVTWIATGAAAVMGTMVTLYTRAVNAENQNLKTELELMKTQHKSDISRIEGAHDEIWQEIKLHRDSLAQNREAVIRLNSSIERLNDILPRLEQVVMGMTLHDPSVTLFNRRATDKHVRWSDTQENYEGPAPA